MNANNSIIKFTFTASLVITFILISLSVSKEGFADDLYFSNALTNRSLWTFLSFRYTEWSGRFFIELLTVTTINHSLFWKIGIPLCVISSSFLLWSICLRDSVPLRPGVLLSLVLILTINQQILDEAHWWVTGFYNYLLPMTCALFVVDSNIRGKASVSRIATSSILSLIATSSEQIALGLMVVMLCLVIKRIVNKDVNAGIAIIFAFVIIGALTTFLSPGSSNRFTIESSRFMPFIGNMSILQKATIGIDRITEFLATGINITFIMCLISFIFYVYKKINPSKTSYMVITLCIIGIAEQLIQGHRIYGVEFISYEGKFIFTNFSSISNYITFSFYSVLLAVMSIGSIEDNEGERDYSAALCLILGTLLTIAIGMSPTAYASSSRVLYTISICMILYTLFLFGRAIKQE